MLQMGGQLWKDRVEGVEDVEDVEEVEEVENVVDATGQQASELPGVGTTRPKREGSFGLETSRVRSCIA